MRIRVPFAAAFGLLLLVAGYAGLTSLQVGGVVNDKLLHGVTFFALTTVFYWIVDTSRRRTLNMTLAVCTFGLGVGSELLQAAIPNNGRIFDAMDIVANIVGSVAAVALCSWYHKRMLERKRHRKYDAVPGDESGAVDVDIELGEGIGGGHDLDENHSAPLATPAITVDPPSTSQGTSQGKATTATTATGSRAMTLEEEVDNWDENAEDPWGDEDDGDVGTSAKGKAADIAEPKKHAD